MLVPLILCSVFCFGGLGVVFVIDKMIRSRLDNDAGVAAPPEEKIFAFTRLAFVFFLVQGTQWLGGQVRTPVFQDYVGWKEEQEARRYGVMVLLPCVLLYNILCSQFRPQQVLVQMCCAFGGLLCIASMYTACLDMQGGKGSISAFDDPEGDFSWFYKEAMRTRMMYLMFMAFELRSVLLYAACMSFFQLFMGTKSKNLNVSVFAFVNLWQQIGTFIFLGVGTSTKSMAINLGAGSQIDGVTVVMAFIGILTFVFPMLANPAYDILEKLKAKEECASSPSDDLEGGSAGTSPGSGQELLRGHSPAEKVQWTEMGSKTDGNSNEWGESKTDKNANSSIKGKPLKEGGIKAALWEAVEGLTLILRHSFVFLLFLTTYSNLAIRSIMDAQLGAMLASIFHMPADDGLAIKGAFDKQVKNSKVSFTSTLMLVGGIINIGLNFLGTKGLVKKLGPRKALFLNPIVGFFTVCVFCGSDLTTCQANQDCYLITSHAAYSVLNGKMVLDTPVQWNSKVASKISIGDAANSSSDKSVGLDFVFGETSKKEADGKVLVYSWLNHLTSTKAEKEVKKDKNSEKKEEKKEAEKTASGMRKSNSSKEMRKVEFSDLVKLDEKSRPIPQFVMHGKTDKNKFKDFDACFESCRSHFMDCAYFSYQNNYCAIFTHRAGAGLPLNKEAVDEKTEFYMLQSPRTYAEVAKEAQKLNAAALIINAGKSTDEVGGMNPTDDNNEISIPTAVLDNKQVKKIVDDEKKLADNIFSIELFPASYGISLYTRYIMIAIGYVLWTAVHFAVNTVLVNILYLRTTPQIKVKAKSWSSSFGNNILKFVGLQVNITFNYYHFDAVSTFLFCAFWTVLWILVVHTIGSKYDELEERDEIVGKEVKKSRQDMIF